MSETNDDGQEPVEPNPVPRHAAAEEVVAPDLEQNPPLMEIDDLALHHRGRRVFGPVTTTIPAGVLVVVHGPAGSGRSSLLLTLVGRMRGTTGTVNLLSPPPRAQESWLNRWRNAREHRRATSIARISTLVDLDSQLTVGESVTERCLADQLATTTGQSRFTELVDLVGTDVTSSALVGNLPALDRAIVTAILAMLRPARLVVLDDVDAGLDTDGQAELLTTLAHLATSEDTTVVASTCDLRGVATDTLTITLDPPPSEES